MSELCVRSFGVASVSIITLTTDFGLGSPYVAAMKGVILSINPAVTLVDITHGVRPQDVRQGAMVLDDVTRRFPAGTIHVAVVDPGVGTDRAIVAARIGGQEYVAPDNGLLSLVARRSPPEWIVRLARPEHWLQPVSATFHGRDKMAPVAARLSLGLDSSELGPPQSHLIELDWPDPVQSPGRIEGQIIDVDGFGNLITNLTADLLATLRLDIPLQITFGPHRLDRISHTYGDHATGELIALIGSTGRLEMAIVNGNASATLRFGPGERIVIEHH
jgi:S-adenosyl-L-methionine hydrolase (adenosine-forming)